MPELHIRECRVVFHFSDQDRLLELLHERNVHENPNGVICCTFSIEVLRSQGAGGEYLGLIL